MTENESLDDFDKFAEEHAESVRTALPAIEPRDLPPNPAPRAADDFLRHVAGASEGVYSSGWRAICAELLEARARVQQLEGEMRILQGSYSLQCEARLRADGRVRELEVWIKRVLDYEHFRDARTAEEGYALLEKGEDPR